MKEQSINKAKLGIFVLSATLFLLLGLYYIGSKKNIFHSTIQINSNFTNVGGLLSGDNVRFNGINVGTVSKIYPVADTTIKVEFTIDEGLTKFISQNAITSIGTDGLLGSKLINISPGKGSAGPVKEGCLLVAQNPLQMDNALRTLTATNDNLKVITDNLKTVSEKFNDNKSLWHLLSDTLIASNVRTAIVKFKLTGINTAIVTGDLSTIVKDIKAGKGAAGALLTDTSFSHKLNQTIINFKTISDTVALIMGNFKTISGKLKNGNGSIGTLLTDTMFVHNLNSSLKNVERGAGSFDENMIALRHSWPFKKYFRKQMKEKK
jgi:phospholipid/cholesterol/gamma-HCH transport system substrate-binding protein